MKLEGEPVKPEDERDLTLEINQLSDGQRAVLALAADLARRMAQGNPHLNDPLASEAIVLIDEVELHLHPSWQQRILNDLRRTFPQHPVHRLYPQSSGADYCGTRVHHRVRP